MRSRPTGAYSARARSAGTPARSRARTRTRAGRRAVHASRRHRALVARALSALVKQALPRAPDRRRRELHELARTDRHADVSLEAEITARADEQSLLGDRLRERRVVDTG